jgi:acyl CoA:acetate/3-ketoacid CoA transferase alpha subunit
MQFGRHIRTPQFPNDYAALLRIAWRCGTDGTGYRQLHQIGETQRVVIAWAQDEEAPSYYRDGRIARLEVDVMPNGMPLGAHIHIGGRSKGPIQLLRN